MADVARFLQEETNPSTPDSASPEMAQFSAQPPEVLAMLADEAREVAIIAKQLSLEEGAHECLPQKTMQRPDPYSAATHHALESQHGAADLVAFQWQQYLREPAQDDDEDDQDVEEEEQEAQEEQDHQDSTAWVGKYPEDAKWAAIKVDGESLLTLKTTKLNEYFRLVKMSEADKLSVKIARRRLKNCGYARKSRGLKKKTAKKPTKFQ
jgi:hypothetical protein